MDPGKTAEGMGKESLSGGRPEEIGPRLLPVPVPPLEQDRPDTILVVKTAGHQDKIFRSGTGDLSPQLQGLRKVGGHEVHPGKQGAGQIPVGRGGQHGSPCAKEEDGIKNADHILGKPVQKIRQLLHEGRRHEADLDRPGRSLPYHRLEHGGQELRGKRFGPAHPLEVLDREDGGDPLTANAQGREDTKILIEPSSP